MRSKIFDLKGDHVSNRNCSESICSIFQGDMETLTTLMSDDYVAILPESMPNGGTFNGANDFIQNCLSKIPGLWSDFNIEPIQMYESGNIVFMHAKITAGGKSSETIHMSIIENDKYVKFQAFDDSAALNATANI